MIRFEFISKSPREERLSIYTVMCDDPACKLEIIDLSELPNRANAETHAMIYHVEENPDNIYYYKIKLLDSIDPIPDDGILTVIEHCWDWWLTRYLLE